jgi:hypothetical protein
MASLSVEIVAAVVSKKIVIQRFGASVKGYSEGWNIH